MHKILKIVALVLSLLGAVSLIRIFSDGDEVIKAAALEGDTALIDPMMVIAYVILVIVLVFVMFFVFKNLFSNASGLKSTLIGVGAFLAILFISYLISSGTDIDLEPFTKKGLDYDEGTSKYVGAGLYAFYALAVIALLSMAFSGVKKLIK